MRLLLLLSLCLLAPRAAWAALPWAERWEAQLQARGIGQDEARFPFETTVEMERFAAQAVRGCRRGTERLGCLQRALFDPDGLGFTYDDSHTRDARQAFADGRGDCFAFSTLFVALARSLGADARLVSVPGPPSSTRLLDGSVLVTEHLAVMSFSAGRAQLFDFQQGDSDARRFVESLDLSGFAPGAPGAPIECAEEEGAEDSGWRWVSCVQDGRRLRVAVVDTGRGPRLDLFRWSFEPFTGVPGEAVTGGLP